MNCPPGLDPDRLFEYVITRLLAKMTAARMPIENEFLDHNSWANRIFGIASKENIQKLSMVIEHFGSFLERDSRRRYKWKLDEISEAHPSIVQRLVPNGARTDRPTSPTSAKDPKSDTSFELSELKKALKEEIIEAGRTDRKSKYPIKGILSVFDRGRGQIYQLLLDLKEEDDPKLMEGQPVKIESEGGSSVDATVLEFDNDISSVFVDLKNETLRKQGKKVLKVETVWLLRSIGTVLDSINMNAVQASGLPINKFLKRPCAPDTIPEQTTWSPSPSIRLDQSQQKAVAASLRNDISLIWGPPGTGKSTTLAEIVFELLRRGEKTLVTGVANVAVDAIALKFVNRLCEHQGFGRWVSSGQALRVGYCKNNDLLKYDFLFPKGIVVEMLKIELSSLFERLKNPHLSAEQWQLIKVEISEKKNRLKDETDRVIASANLIFATATKATVDSNLQEMEFDNLIVDEASMMSVPVFMAMAYKVKKRIILCGDFRQLGPIAQAQGEIARRWLHRDLFDFAGVKNSETPTHPALHLLDTQRRFPQDICAIINVPFYSGLLKTQYTDPRSTVALNSKPFAGRPISYIHCKMGESFKAEKTRTHSRKNEGSIELLCDLIKEILANNSEPSIGIITPYRGQVKLIEQALRALDLNEQQRSCIKVGTIHSFQGSEREWIILDLVESGHLKVGRLYRHDEGKRLMNVAISRTKAKLIVVGDLDVFSQGKGSNSVDHLVRVVTSKIRMYGVNWIP